MGFEYSQVSSTNLNFPLLRLMEQYKKHGRLIIAYDFDDTVSPFYCANCTEVQSLLRMAKNTIDAYFIVYTSNPNIERVKDFLDKNNLPYDSINENAPFVNYSGGKVFYNIFLDDKAGLAQAASNLKDLLYMVKNNLI
jgi:hypothetical protein